MGNTRTHTEEERKQKDAVTTKVWNEENKDRKSELNKSWRQNNNNAEYLRRYRKLKKLSAVLSDYCFWDEEIFKNKLWNLNTKKILK